MVQKGNTDPLLPLYKKLHHRSNDSYLCACEGRAAQDRQDGNLTEGFWQIGDFVLISYQMVSHACSSIRSAVFVWSRPECCLVGAASQSYRICRQNPFFSHSSTVLKAFLSSLLVFFDSTSLEMSQSDCGSCSQAGAFVLLVDVSRGRSSQLNPKWHFWVSWKRLQHSCLSETRSVSAWWEM